MKQRIDEWKKMVDAGDPAANDQLVEITVQAREEGKLDEMNEAAAYLLNAAATTLDEVENSMAEYTLHERMGTLSEVINLAYIARNYFGKTRQWLYQRLKGQMVNGKRAAFTPDEKATFISALNDIDRQIAVFARQI